MVPDSPVFIQSKNVGSTNKCLEIRSAQLGTARPRTTRTKAAAPAIRNDLIIGANTSPIPGRRKVPASRRPAWRRTTGAKAAAPTRRATPSSCAWCNAPRPTACFPLPPPQHLAFAIEVECCCRGEPSEGEADAVLLHLVASHRGPPHCPDSLCRPRHLGDLRGFEQLA